MTTSLEWVGCSLGLPHVLQAHRLLAIYFLLVLMEILFDFQFIV